jgi:hypothetical protein
MREPYLAARETAIARTSSGPLAYRRALDKIDMRGSVANIYEPRQNSLRNAFFDRINGIHRICGEESWRQKTGSKNVAKPLIA